MGSEGQNSPNQTSGAERKRPWEIFPEAEISAIEKKKKQLDLHEKKRLRREKCRAKITSLKQLIKKHKIISTAAFLLLIVTLFFISIIGPHVFNGIFQQNSSESEKATDELHADRENPFTKITIKTAASPNDAYYATILKLKPILFDGINQTGAINFSKLEDNYNAFSKTVETEYEKICYYLAMLDVMFGFDDPFGNERALFLLNRFDEKKISLDDTQMFFYLSAKASYAFNKEDKSEYFRYQTEIENKYPLGVSPIDYETGEIITNEEEIKKYKEEILKNVDETTNEE